MKLSSNTDHCPLLRVFLLPNSLNKLFLQRCVGPGPNGTVFIQFSDKLCLDFEANIRFYL